MHQIDARDRFRDRMFDLKAGVHLDEVELAVLEEELDRAGAGIAEVGNGARAGGADLGPLFLVERWELASSQTFWWRRCSEQSRSPRWMPLPAPSPNTCSSMWRGFPDTFRCRPTGCRRRRPPRSAPSGQASIRSSSLRATFMPRPPPPAVALTMTDSRCHRRCAWLRPRRRRRRRSPEPPGCEALGRALGLDLVTHDADVVAGRGR